MSPALNVGIASLFSNKSHPQQTGRLNTDPFWRGVVHQVSGNLGCVTHYLQYFVTWILVPCSVNNMVHIRTALVWNWGHGSWPPLSLMPPGFGNNTPSLLARLFRRFSRIFRPQMWWKFHWSRSYGAMICFLRSRILEHLGTFHPSGWFLHFQCRSHLWQSREILWLKT